MRIIHIKPGRSNEFQEHTTAVRFERAVIGTGRATGVGVRLERFPTVPILVIADGQVAGDEINFFPIVVHEGLRRADTEVEPQSRVRLPLFPSSSKAPDRIFCWMPSGYPGGTSQPLLKSTA